MMVMDTGCGCVMQCLVSGFYHADEGGNLETNHVVAFRKTNNTQPWVASFLGMTRR